MTNRDTEILRSVARGYKRHEIAAQLGISAGTVGNHITSIYRKLEVSSNIEAVAIASRAGML
ncbi:response regulator transcription factor [Gymnodinialimonas phycosphaerae]|uniref:response regulator transcription factor n=1 Tax=Gymnodinialimonas phycosphaerae TaxID=2841589 RepID=UPI002151C91A|nr:LuxR C-terminal-related transcriptional regulator [Gymnodinialimonas phycosphaerae]